MVELTDSNLVSVNIDVPKRQRPSAAKEEGQPAAATIKEEPKTAAPESVDMSALLP